MHTSAHAHTFTHMHIPLGFLSYSSTRSRWALIGLLWLLLLLLLLLLMLLL